MDETEVSNQNEIGVHLQMTDEDIKNRFNYHSPSQDGVKRHARLSQSFENIAGVVESICPEGREKSLAMTKLEEAKFWASAAVARNPDTV